MTPRIILVTGPSAAGKSTVAQGVAERLPRSVHLRGDVFRKMVVNGRAMFGRDLDGEAQRQLRLRWDIAAAVAENYLEAGFNVVYQDIVVGPALPEIAARFRRWDAQVVVLMPDLATLAARERARGKTAYAGTHEIESLRDAFERETPRIGTWLDTSHLTVEETVSAIMQLLNLDQDG